MPDSSTQPPPPEPEDPKGANSDISGPAGDDVLHLIRRASAGDDEAFTRLFPLLEKVVRALARQNKAKLPGVAVTTTALVNESLRNVIGRGICWETEDTRLFYGLLSRKMHDLLIDKLRKQQPPSMNPGSPLSPIDEVDVR